MFIFDLYLFIIKSKKGFGLVKLQINDILILSNNKFIQCKNSEFKKAKFFAKFIKALEIDYLLLFNNCKIIKNV